MKHDESPRALFSKTMRHERTDRVAVDLMGNASMLLDETYDSIRAYFNLSPIEPFRTGTTANYYDERILDRLGVDFRRIILSASEANTPICSDRGRYTDLWGTTYRRAGIYVNIESHPLERATCPQDIDRHRWPRAEELFVSSGLRAEAKRKYHETEHVLVARNPLTAGVFDRACSLMGMANVLAAMAEAPATAARLFERISSIYLDVYALFLEAVGEYVHVVETADDIATQGSLLMSPSMYREFLKGRDRELYALIRRLAPGAAIFRHTDGAVFDLLSDFVEIGVQIMNPTQTSSRGMEPEGLKRIYGKKMVFHGGIESLDRPIDELLGHASSILSSMSGGGYIFAPCNHVIAMPPENLVALYDLARTFHA